MRSDRNAPLTPLLRALADAFGGESRPGATAAVAALRGALERPYRRGLGTAEPGPVLEAACRLPEALPSAALIWASRDLIDWSPWEGAGLDPAVSSRLYTCELVGPDGHVEAEEVRVGLLVSAPETDYPVSSHAGEETYLVIAGGAAWTVDGAPYAIQAPGALIHHPAWVPHGRRTLTEPLLGAWRWSGDLDLSSFRIAT